MKYLNKEMQAMLAPKIRNALKEVLEEVPGFTNCLGWNRIVEREVFVKLGGKDAFEGDFQKNLYDVMCKMFMNDHECMRIIDEARERSTNGGVE